jgi:hypothetical protein
MNKYATSIKYGVIAGIIMVIIILAIYFISINALAGFVPVIAYVPLIFLMIWGGITVRKGLGNFNGFGHAFLTVFIISFTATMVFDTFNYVLYKYIDPEIPVIIKAKVLENTSEWMEKMGASDEKTEQQLNKLKAEDFSPTIVRELGRYAASAVIGAIFSLVIGLFVNRPDGGRVIKAEE